MLTEALAIFFVQIVYQLFDHIFGQAFDQIFGKGFDQGSGEGKNHKYSIQYYPAQVENLENLKNH